MRSSLEIVRLSQADEHDLIALFNEIAIDPARRYFRPHPFDEENARKIARYPGEDLYCAARQEKRLVAYGMLRGWDEGYEVPSLGLFVSASARGTGIGRLMIGYLHSAAKLRGCQVVRLTVDEGNSIARSLYEATGYVFQQGDAGRLIGTAPLNRA